MGITTIEGPMGTGKTLTMAYFMVNDYLNSLKIIDPTTEEPMFPEGCSLYSTFHFRPPIPFRLFDVDEMQQMLALVDAAHAEYGDQYTFRDPFEGCSIGLDESYLFFDNRRSAANNNLLFNALLARTRKLEANIYITVLSINDIDKRIRRFVTTRIKPRSAPNSWVKLFMKDLRSGRSVRAKFWGPSYYQFYDTGERVGIPKHLLKQAGA